MGFQNFTLQLNHEMCFFFSNRNFYIKLKINFVPVPFQSFFLTYKFNLHLSMFYYTPRSKHQTWVYVSGLLILCLKSIDPRRTTKTMSIMT